MNVLPPASARIDLGGRVALVTGGGRGIGRAIAERFLQAGCEVVICGRTTQESLPAADGRTARFVACDVRDPEQARGLIDEVVQRHGRLDVLVNNAGGSPEASAASVSPRFMQAIVNLNLMAPMYLSQAAYGVMNRQDGGGAIINIASISAERPSPGTAAYGAAKAGLLSLTRSLAQEWGPQVRVNAIVVGLVETETAERTYGTATAQQAIASSLPLQRMGRGGDIADAALFLASPLAAYVSGATLPVHGGGERPYFLELVKQHAG